MISLKYAIYVSGLTAIVDFQNIRAEIIIIIIILLLMRFWIN